MNVWKSKYSTDNSHHIKKDSRRICVVFSWYTSRRLSRLTNSTLFCRRTPALQNYVEFDSLGCIISAGEAVFSHPTRPKFSMILFIQFSATLMNKLGPFVEFHTGPAYSSDLH